jgi:hypothetical protein
VTRSSSWPAGDRSDVSAIGGLITLAAFSQLCCSEPGGWLEGDGLPCTTVGSAALGHGPKGRRMGRRAQYQFHRAPDQESSTHLQSKTTQTSRVTRLPAQTRHAAVRDHQLVLHAYGFTRSPAFRTDLYQSPRDDASSVATLTGSCTPVSLTPLTKNERTRQSHYDRNAFVAASRVAAHTAPSSHTN